VLALRCYFLSAILNLVSITWENHHCEKHENTQISPNLTHKLWKMLAPGMPGRSYQTKPGLPSGCQVNIKCFYANKSTCLGSNHRNISSLTLVQKVIPGYLQITVDNYTCGLFPMIFRMVCPSWDNSRTLWRIKLKFFCGLGFTWGRFLSKTSTSTSWILLYPQLMSTAGACLVNGLVCVTILVIIL
jgi:hypothetical protein